MCAQYNCYNLNDHWLFTCICIRFVCRWWHRTWFGTASMGMGAVKLSTDPFRRLMSKLGHWLLASMWGRCEYKRRWWWGCCRYTREVEQVASTLGSRTGSEMKCQVITIIILVITIVVFLALLSTYIWYLVAADTCRTLGRGVRDRFVIVRGIGVMVIVVRAPTIVTNLGSRPGRIADEVSADVFVRSRPTNLKDTTSDLFLLLEDLQKKANYIHVQVEYQIRCVIAIVCTCMCRPERKCN